MAAATECGTSAPQTTIDWRFLIPRPARGRFRRLLVLGGGDAADAEDASRLADCVERICPDTPICDGIVVRFDATDTLSNIVRAAAPGGALYLELDRGRRGWRASSLVQLRRRLAAAGLPIQALYTVEPDFAQAQAVLPLGSAPALAWFSRTHFTASSRAHWLGASARRGVQRLSARAGAMTCRRLVVVASGNPRHHTLAHVHAAAAVAARSDAPAVHTDVALLTFGRDRVILLPFSRREPTPLVVAKAPKQPQFDDRTRNEHAVLETLHAQLPAPLLHAIPRPHALIATDAGVLSVQSFIRGRTLASAARDFRTGHGARVADLRLAIEWLGALHRATEEPRQPWSEAAHARWVADPLDTFVREFGVTPLERALFDQTTARSWSLRGTPFSMVWQHRDFNVWNLVRNGRQLGVLDWEGAQRGLPLVDAFQLTTSWLHAAEFPRDATAESQAVTQLFGGDPSPNPSATAALAALRRYLHAIALDERFVPIWLVAHRVELALRRLEQRRDEGGDTRAAAIPEYPVIPTLAGFTSRLFARPWFVAP